jgi:hypothetical protein
MTEVDHVAHNGRLLEEARDREVNSPSHYKFGDTGMEVIDIIEAAVADIRDGKEAFYLSQVLKYVLRYRGKGGLLSLMKGSFYLLRMIAYLTKREKHHSSTYSQRNPTPKVSEVVNG